MYYIYHEFFTPAASGERGASWAPAPEALCVSITTTAEIREREKEQGEREQRDD